MKNIFNEPSRNRPRPFFYRYLWRTAMLLLYVDISAGTKEAIQDVRSGLKGIIRGLRRAIQHRGYNNDL